jgi:hypothetical protein
LFHDCRSNGKGGAIFAIINVMTQSSNCFHLCRCGKENGNDGSTIYAFSGISITSSLISADSCPKHGDQCWYGVFIFCRGVLDSQNINISNSDVEYISGLAHFQPAIEGSTIRWYTAMNNINGNALAFIDFNFPGNHEFGSLVNNTSKSGILYVQNTTTTLRYFYFLRNTGALTYAYGSRKGNFEYCVFSSKAENLGGGFGSTFECKFDERDATPLPMTLLNTVYCEWNYPMKRKPGKSRWVPQVSIFIGTVLIVIALVRTHMERQSKNSWRRKGLA